MDNKKLLLVDGSSLLSTGFYGNLPHAYKFAKTDAEKDAVLDKILQTKDGRFTNGVFTMMKTLERIIEKQNITHIAVAWDISRDTFRREIYPEYKAHRGETRPELKSQFILTQEVLAAMNVPQFMFKRYEADDILGTLSSMYGSQISTYVITKDQDALQLVDEYTKLWLITSKAGEMYKEVGIDVSEFNVPYNAFEFTPQLIEHFYQLSPRQIIDKKSLEGDKSDNIPGVSGCGEKSAIPLLQEFGNIEEIYNYIENNDEKTTIKDLLKDLGIKKSPVKNLLEQKDKAFLSKKLATIKLDVDMVFNLELLNIFNEEKERIESMDSIEELKGKAKELELEIDNLDTEDLDLAIKGLVKALTEKLSIKLDSLKLEDLELKINEEGREFIYRDLGFNSLLQKNEVEKVEIKQESKVENVYKEFVKKEEKHKEEESNKDNQLAFF